MRARFGRKARRSQWSARWFTDTNSCRFERQFRPFIYPQDRHGNASHRLEINVAIARSSIYVRVSARNRFPSVVRSVSVGSGRDSFEMRDAVSRGRLSDRSHSPPHVNHNKPVVDPLSPDK